MKSNDSLGALGGLLIIVLWLAGVIGWFINLWVTVGLALSGEPVSALFVLRAIGIVVAPLGAVLGLFVW